MHTHIHKHSDEGKKNGLKSGNYSYSDKSGY